MAITAPVQDGKVVDTSASANSSSTSSSKASKNNTSGLGKEAFLQLLVAQMQYQDPLQPTDNTEYIAQLATFSQLEATQNLEDTVDKDMANNLVGKYVILNTADSTGRTSTISGKVDYVMYENGEVFLAVNDGLYSLADLDTVANEEYYEAFEMANLFSNMMAGVPSVDNATVADVDKIKQAITLFDAMTPYQQKFLNDDDVKKLQALTEKFKDYITEEDTKEPSTEGTDGAEENKPTEGADGAENA